MSMADNRGARTKRKIASVEMKARVTRWSSDEIAAMPAGTHEILEQTRQAVERRARALLTQLQELGDESAVKAVNAEGETAEEAVLS